MYTGSGIGLPAPVDDFRDFSRKTRVLLARGIDRLEARGKVETGELRACADTAFGELESQPTRTAVEVAFASLDTTTTEMLTRELRYVTANIDDQSADEQADVESASDVKTGKDSLEAFLGKWLPRPVRHALKVVNELLSIVFKV